MKKVFLNIKVRLIILLVVVGLIPLIILSYIVLNRSHQALTEQAFAQLESINFAKKAQFEQYVSQIRADISVLANSTHLGNALDAFASTLEEGELDQAQYDYFESLEYGDSFRQFIKQYGYYDLMLISQVGDIVYSTKRENDFNLNINNKPLSDNLLGKLFHQGLEKVTITDFQLYAFSDSQPLSFLMAPIKINDDEIIGVVALKVSLEKINQIMLERSGMGKTGKSYLVGADYLMRSNSYLDPINRSVEHSFLNPKKTEIKTKASLSALAGKSGEEILLDYRGINTLSIYTPIQWGSNRFALISEIDESEALSVIEEMQFLIILIGLILLGLIIITATYIATVFTQPIRQLTQASIEISKGNIIKNIGVHRQDELGVLSDNFFKMQDSIFKQIDVIEQQKHELNLNNSNLEKLVEHRTQALEAERQQLQLILDTSPVGVGISTNGIFRYTNSTMTELLGIEIDGASHDVYVNPEDRDQIMADLKREGIVENREIQFYNNQHQINDVMISFMQFQYDNKDSILGWAIDLTERKESQKKLEYQQQQFASMVSNVPGAIYRVIDDSAWPIIYMSDEIEKITGYPAADFMDSKIVTFSTIMYPEDVAPIGQEIQAQFAQGKNFQVDYRVIRKTGEIVWVRSQGQSTQSENGEAWIDGVLIDITEAKNVENELKLSKEIAEEATRAKSDFLANMSHEIRTPMNAIIGMSHLALQTDLNAKQNNYIEKVHRSGEALLGIINDILDFSKIEAGKLDIEKVDFRLEDVFENLANLVGLKAEENALELMFDLPLDIPTALIGDPLRLGQILINLGNNAVKFTEQGEIVVKVELLEQDDNQVKLHFSIRDSGVGMTIEQQNKLFQSFSQADTSTTRKYGGTGLGLSISKKLTELMEGEIWAESETDVGSTFHFTARLSKQQGDISPRRSASADLGSLHVLVVDDNPSAREILSSMLASFGLRIDQASTGEIALAQLDRANDNDPYQLVLMDWKMPGMDGIEVAQAIQEDTHLSKLPTIIMVTAYGKEEASHAAEDVNISAFLTKPVTPSSLLDAIMIAMGHEVSQEISSSHHHLGAESAIASLRGAHVLLVEDNDMNQELAMELLRSNGVSAVLAKDGQEALDKLEKESFDGVLMDCQMPIMDGYTATRELRKKEKYKDLPILAMTANAMLTDKEKVLDAGMNDHITKPINVKDMFTTMAKWITASNPDRVVADYNASLEGETVNFPVLNGIDTVKGLFTCQGDKKLYKKLLIKFKENTLSFVSQFKTERLNDDSEAAIRLVHSFKSMAGNIGAIEVEKSSQKLESACKEGQDDDVIAKLLSEVESVLSIVLTSLESLEETTRQLDTAETTLDKDRLNSLFVQLRERLQDDDTDAADVVEEILSLPGISKHKIMMKRLLKAIDEYEFQQAIDELTIIEQKV